MPRSRLLFLTAAILLGLAAFLFLRPRTGGAGERPPATSTTAPASSAPAARTASALAAPAPEKIENRKSEIENPSPAGSTIADALNSPDSTIRRDLTILDELFGAFHTNFPRLGNPVGENAEITAALTGANPANFVFISPRHRAINARGQLCDRWGTPFRFHQVSGSQMEIRSAGPDQKFATPDDVEFSPGSK